MDLKCLAVSLLLMNLWYHAESSKILGVFWTPSRSHHILGSALLQALAKKGHDVTLMTPFIDDVKIPTFKQEKLEGIIGSVDPFINPNVTFIQRLKLGYSIMKGMSAKFWKNDAVQKLIKSKENYDVVISLGFFNDGLLALNHYLEAPTIIFCSGGSNSIANKYAGNPNLPYTLALQFSRPNTFIGRLISVAAACALSFLENCIFNSYQEATTREYLPNAPPISQLLNNISLVFVNSHYSIESPRPYVPNMVQIGGFYAQTIEQLPADFQEYLDSAEAGVILFSFGTNIKMGSFEKLDVIVEGLAKIAPTKVIFKSETDLTNCPSNVLVRKWIPQNAILAHSNLRAFISHGGMGGTTESVFHGVPMLGIPFYADQKTNIMSAAESGYALPLFHEDLTQENFDQSLKEILTNPKYTREAKLRSSLLRNQPINPLDKAIWWVEHIIEFKGGKHLRNLGMDLKWYQMYMVDVILFYSVIILVLLYINFIITRWVLRKTFRMLLNRKNKKVKKA